MSLAGNSSWVLYLLCLLLLLQPAKAAEQKSSPTTEKSQKKNVILIMADDLGYECLGGQGGNYKTPFLDAMAQSGVRFNHCHVQPLCTPTRVQLMTGQYNVRNYYRFGTLLRTEKTFGNLFQQAGYVTGICGKWQLGKELDSPQHFGFKESFLWQHTRRPPRFANPGLEHNGKELNFSRGEYGPQLVNDFALNFITRHRQKPFFLYYPMILTHNPFQPTPDSPDYDPKAMGEKVNQHPKHFAAMVTLMDKMLGKLLAKLDELELRDNTLVIFLGDNGTNRSITSELHGKKYPGGKGSTTVRGTHVPLIIDGKALKLTQGKICDDLISSVDFLPTICDWAQIKYPKQLDGQSFFPQLQGHKGKPREIVYCWYSPRQRKDLTVKEFAMDKQFKLYRDGRFFDLSRDRFEEKAALQTRDLSPAARQSFEKLQKTLDQMATARPRKLDENFRREKK